MGAHLHPCRTRARRIRRRVTQRHNQVRYDLSKLRAKGLVARIGKSRRYCLTPIGLKLGVLLVKLRLRLLGPLASLIRQPSTNASSRRSNPVDAAYREVDTALDQLSAALGLPLANASTVPLNPADRKSRFHSEVGIFHRPV